ncbi:hypothetical protein [Hymenobacter lucidus]|uniref:Uncharacterized protein n=1 Tax=Hymenobacter lucidus TaxID=2880930 RepID=A0ABS8AUB4_9BACT|nr:hypothetical protein [Hymenobacter lucidus]MCB2409797.1 hypothetical protein [Hymenobacter lucidus]
MQKTREWLDRHGSKVMVALSLFLFASGLVGQLRGRSAVLVTDHDQPAQVAQSPVWLLYCCAAVPLLIILLSKRAAAQRRRAVANTKLNRAGRRSRR